MRVGAKVVGVLAVFALACGPGAERGRVLIVGLDGADPEALAFLVAEGRLPNLQQLGGAGVSGSVRSLLPLLSPRIWTTVATGKVPEKHGVLGWTYKDASGEDRLYLGRHREGAALWNIASDAGLTVGIVQWWTTFPPEVVNGVFISDHAADRAGTAPSERPAARFDASTSTVLPAAWEQRVLDLHRSPPELPGLPAGLFSPHAMFGADADKPIPPPIDRIPVYMTGVYDHDRATVAAALAVDSALRPELLMVLLPGIDRTSHLFWSAFDPPPDFDLAPEAQEKSREALFRAYEVADTMVGLLAQRFGPRDLVLVLSDHGFESLPTAGLSGGGHETAAAQNGIFLARGPGIAPGSKADGMRIQDVTPSVLAFWGLPVADDMDGQPAAFLAAPAPERITSYDSIPIDRPGRDASGAEAKILDDLRALGYVE